MTPPVFSVFTTSRFDREYKKLAAYHPDLAEHYARILPALQTDPYNRTRLHPIKKLVGVPPGARHNGASGQSAFGSVTISKARGCISRPALCATKAHTAADLIWLIHQPRLLG